MLHDDILGTIGSTPLVRLHRVTRGVSCRVYAKVESFNPGGSVKDRIGIAMIRAAEERGELRPGGTIIEGTSGNTGIGLAIAGAVLGYRCVFTITDKQSQEKINLLRAFGAEVIVCPTAVEPEDPRSYYSVAKRLADETPNSCYVNQYYNPANPEIHQRTTGPEIWQDTDGAITHFVAGMGTGGTITGVGRYLKEQREDVRIVGVDPVGSLFHEKFHEGTVGKARTYVVEGIGEDIFPDTLDMDVLDDVVQVDDKECFVMTRRLAREEGILAGGSCGGAVAGALQVARNLDDDALMVVLLPDTGERYLGKIFNDDWMRDNGYLDEGWGITAADALARKDQRRVLHVAPDATVREALRIMKEEDVSQLVVMEDDRPVGAVGEGDLIDLFANRSDAFEEEVGSVMTDPFPLVDEDTDLRRISRMINDRCTAVLVRTNGELDLISKYDLIQALVQRT